MAIKRLNWLKWLRPGQTGLQTEQEYWNEKRRRHMSNEHSQGVVEGLAVTEGSTALHVDIATGRAIAPNGDDIVIESIQDLDLSSYAAAGALVYIVTEFAETLTDPYYVPQIGSSQSKYHQESPTVTHQSSAPTGDQVELARVNVIASATDITDPANPLDPQNNEINLLNRKVSELQMNGVKPGYKILNPAGASVLTQMALLGCQPGDRFWMIPGTYDLGPAAAAYEILISDITIEGPKSAIVQVEGSELKIWTGAHAWTLRGFTVDVSGSVSDTYAILVGGDGDHRIEDLTFTRSGSATAVSIGVTSSAARTTIRGCVFEGTGTSCISVLSTSNPQLLIEDCVFTTLDTLAADSFLIITAFGNRGIGTVIRHCTFNITDAPGTELRVGVVPAEKWVIEDCDFVGDGAYTYSHGIYSAFDDANDWIIRNCRFTDLQRGVNMPALENHRTLIEGNRFVGMLDYGIYFESDVEGLDNGAINNYFEDCKNSIGYIWQKRLKVNGNIIVSTIANGTPIALTDVEYSVVDQNNINVSVTSGNAYGIRVTSSGDFRYITLSRNTINVETTDTVTSSGIEFVSGDFISVFVEGNVLEVASGGAAGIGGVGIKVGGNTSYSNITDNIVIPGNGSAGTTIGVYILGATVNCCINDNTIRGGAATTKYGIWIVASGLNCRRNIICNNNIDNMTLTQSITESAGSEDYNMVSQNKVDASGITTFTGVNTIKTPNIAF